LTCVDKSIKYDTNDLPGTITREAKFKCPNNCKSSLLVHDLFPQYISNEFTNSVYFDDCSHTSSVDMELYTDASASKGFGGYYTGKWFS
jgi:hypothetical protein